MTRLVSFGDYTFDDRETAFSTNFGDAVPRTVRLPGMDGGYDEFGDDPAPTEIGNVRATFRFAPGSGSAMQTIRDALRALTGLGRRALVIEPSGGTAQRWTYARLNSAQVPERMPVETDRVQTMTLDFQVSDPRWYSPNAASGTAAACAGTATDFSRANGGNASALPVITVIAGTAALTTGATIKRLVASVVRDRIVYATAVVAGGTLVIDCRALAVALNGVEAYGTAFAADHPAWMRLLPGDNDYRVELGAGKTASVSFEWDDTWY